LAQILVVDDDPEVRSFIVRVLASEGHLVSEAADGVEALEVLDKRHHDLILTDVYMAEMDGMELLSRIQRRSVRIPVVVISGGGFATREEVLRMAAARGAVATLEKPFTAGQLREIVERQLKPDKPPR
jgi:CheY-like chemotaxis protein